MQPEELIELLLSLTAELPPFDRVALGFPGVVVDNLVRSSRLESVWVDYPLGRELEVRMERMVRIVNNTDLRGYGVIEGQGVEVVLTLGQTLGSSLFLDGRLVPNFRFGGQFAKKNCDYTDLLGQPSLKRIGSKRWSKRVWGTVRQVRTLLNPRCIYLGGGNIKKLKGATPEDVALFRSAGLSGGVRLWED